VKKSSGKLFADLCYEVTGMATVPQKFLKMLVVFAVLGFFFAILAGVQGTAWGKQKTTPASEALVYNNPFHQKVKMAWYNGRKIKHLSLGATTARPLFKIAQQYNLIYEDQFKEPPTTVQAFEVQEKAIVGVAIYDSVPGDPNYSPIWQINWVLVPRTYKPDTVRSADGVKKLGYKIVSSNIWQN
jgi:hypothetical protein